MAKKIILILLISAPFIAMAWQNSGPDKSAATVEQYEGLYVFIRCKPVAAYDYLGSEKKGGLVMSGSPTEMFNILVRRAKKDYPTADGIIFTNEGLSAADIIKFK